MCRERILQFKYKSLVDRGSGAKPAAMWGGGRRSASYIRRAPYSKRAKAKEVHLDGGLDRLAVAAWNRMWTSSGKSHLGKGDKITVVPAMDTRKRGWWYASHVPIAPPRAGGTVSNLEPESMGLCLGSC